MKKTALSIIGALLLFAGAAFGQGIVAPGVAPLGQTGCSGGGGGAHRVGAIFYAPCYASYQAQTLSGNAASGSASIVVFDAAGGAGGVVLGDGSLLPLATFFNTNTPITINDANAETVTPSAVSIGPCPVGNLGVGGVIQCATITATFSNTHGASALVYSGDAGIFEAITDAGNLGGGLVYWATDTGIVTLNTGSVTTTTATKVPSVYISMGSSGRVTTTITTSTSWAVGTATNTTDFCTAQTTLTAGTTCSVVNMSSPTARTTGAPALTAIVFTMGTGAPGAGALKARVWGWTPVQATQ